MAVCLFFTLMILLHEVNRERESTLWWSLNITKIMKRRLKCTQTVHLRGQHPIYVSHNKTKTRNYIKLVWDTKKPLKILYSHRSTKGLFVVICYGLLMHFLHRKYCQMEFLWICQNGNAFLVERTIKQVTNLNNIHNK